MRDLTFDCFRTDVEMLPPKIPTLVKRFSESLKRIRPSPHSISENPPRLHGPSKSLSVLRAKSSTQLPVLGRSPSNLSLAREASSYLNVSIPDMDLFQPAGMQEIL